VRFSSACAEGVPIASSSGRISLINGTNLTLEVGKIA
jgi:hypothetical protein